MKEKCPDAMIYIMACDLECEPWKGITLESMDGRKESLDKCFDLGADGVLLNNIEMALEWKNKKFGVKGDR